MADVKLTERQLSVFGNLYGVRGAFVKYENAWTLNSRSVTREINALERKGLIAFWYPSGRPAFSLTDKGSELLAQIEAA